MRTIFGCLALAVAGLGLGLSDSTRLLDTSEENNAVGAGYFTRKACVLVGDNGCYSQQITPGGECFYLGWTNTNCDLQDVYSCETVWGIWDSCTQNSSTDCPKGKVYRCDQLASGSGVWVLIATNGECGTYSICLGAP